VGVNCDRVRRYLLREGDFSEDLREFRERSAMLQGEVIALLRENTALRARVAPLERRILELELRLGELLRIEPESSALIERASNAFEEQTI
jgi:hypothetical protein